MNDLNFHHLRYFWVAAREGSVTRASQRLRVSPSTVSTQIKALEEEVGQPLFQRAGRLLELTAHGEVVRRYADEIFALGDELVDAVRTTGSPRHVARLRVGVSSHLPKLVAYRILAPLLRAEDQPVHLVCTEDQPDRLVADLAVHQLDLVLTDNPVGLASEVRLESRLLGECGVTVAGAPALARRYREGFPRSLDGAPMLLPDTSSAMRRLLEEWFERTGLRPRVVAELSDSALLKSFGQGGAGLFPVPSLVAEEVAGQYAVVRLGELDGPIERFFAVGVPGRFDERPLRALVDSII